MRLCFERGAAELLTERARPADFTALEEILRRMESAGPEELDPLDVEFHSRMLRITGNRIFPEPEQLSQWLQGADIRPEFVSMPNGSVVMILDEEQVFLGCGKVSGDRIRNFSK